MSFGRGLKLAGFARRHLGRMARGRRQVMSHLSAPGPGNLPMPTFVQLRVTNLCNLRCKMCGQWGDTGIYRAGADASASDGHRERDRIRELILERQMTLADYIRLLDEIAPAADHQPVRRRAAALSRHPAAHPGDQGARPDLLDHHERLAPRGDGPRAVEAGVDSIMVSIDGTPEVHDRIRDRPAAFARRRRREGPARVPRARSAVPSSRSFRSPSSPDDVAPALEAPGRSPTRQRRAAGSYRRRPGGVREGDVRDLSPGSSWKVSSSTARTSRSRRGAS